MKVGDRGCAALLALCCLLGLLALQVAEPHFFLRDDNATHFLAAYTYAYDSVAGAGELPLLNQHQFLGATFLAAGQTGAFLAAMYPVTALLRAVGADARNLIDALATLHLLLGGLGMWQLLRFLGIRRALAFPLALCWCFLPFGVVASRSWIFVSYLMAFLPFNLWLLLRFLERPSARRGTALVTVKALFLLTGYVQYMLIASFFELAFVACRLLLEKDGRRSWRLALAVGAVFGLTALWAAPLLLPLYEAKQASAERAGRLPTETALSFALGPADFARTQLMVPREGALFRHGSTAIYFLGPAVLLGVGLALRRRQRLGKSFAAALVAGLFALAMSTLLYYLLYLTPFFASLRWPFKNFPLAGFFLLVAAAGGLGLFAAESPRRARLAAGLAWLSLGLEAIFFLVPGWRHAFGPHDFDRPVAALRSSPLIEAIGNDGRAITVNAPEDRPAPPAPVRLGFLYATLAGKYHLAGYDPLLAELNHRLSPPTTANTELSFSPAAWPGIRASLEALSGRYLLVSAGSALEPVLAADPGLRLLAENEGMRLFELKTALPIVWQLEGRRPLPFRWLTNGIELDLPADFTGGRILFNLAGLDGYRIWLDGVDRGRPGTMDSRPLVEAPPGARHLMLRYESSSFDAGAAFAAAGFLLLLWALRSDKALGRLVSGVAAPDAQHRLAEGEKK
jgi:hypothetical protein